MNLHLGSSETGHGPYGRDHQVLWQVAHPRLPEMANLEVFRAPYQFR